MIYIDENYPDAALEPSFTPRDVTIKRNIDAKTIYDLISEIGRGKFGTVYKCREKSTGLQLAAKFVPIPKREDRRNVEREVEIMNSLQHSLIIQLYAAYEYQKMMCVVLELVEGGELFDRVVDDDFVLTERVCTIFMRQICEAMQFIHRNNILHLDLKPENILCITKEGNRIKIIDFGLARKYDPDKKLQILFGTPEFVAPEVVNFDSISFGTDMWSVGVICYVLLSGLSPFMGETDIETMANVTIAKYDFDDEAFSNVSPEALDFISKLLLKDMESRMTASQCLEHKWLERRAKSLPPQTIIKQPQIILEPVASIITPSVEINNAKETSTEIISKSLTPATEEQFSPLKKNETLEQTKDNLKSFIERWEEHPNSPYVFDSETNLIAPIHPDNKTKNNSDVSSRAYSPSPCGSISSVSDDIDITTTTNTNKLLLNDTTSTDKSSNQISIQVTSPKQDLQDNEELRNNQNFKDYLNSFDRRNSDTNYILARRSSGEKISLADEIRKLSDHLFMLAEINTRLGKTKEPSSSPNEKLETIHESVPITLSSSATESTKHTNEPIETVKPDSQIKYNVKSSTFTRSKSVIDSSNETPTVSTSSSITKTKKVSSLSVYLQKSSFDENSSSSSSLRRMTSSISNGSIETDTLPQKDRKSKLIDDFKQQILLSSSTTSAAAATNIASGVPWPITNKRTKFRINQMSRDVPIGSPDTHQPIDLEDAANTTKDCLLHLLEKYNQKKWRTSGCGPMGRHQSISIDWNVSENLEYQSISSINAFFRKYSSTSGNNYVKQLQAQLEAKSNKPSK